MQVRRTAVLALVLAAVLSACGGHASDHTASIVPGQQGDIAFAQMMIPHHDQAVEMADLALERQTSPEVQALAQQIKAAQDPEIEQMTGWLTQWGASTSGEDHSGMAGMVSESDLEALAGLSGAAFDEKWLTLMIAHHEGALTMAQQVIGTTSEASVRTLAEAIVAGQTAEIAEMKALLNR
jgi:uncharacterized protein (DUF305 family)